METKKINPKELARQALIQLSKNNIPPTPDNYRRVYDLIAGSDSVDASQVLSKSLEKALLKLGKDRPKFITDSKNIASLMSKLDSVKLEDYLSKLITADTEQDSTGNLASLLRYILKQLEVKHHGLTFAKKKDAINNVIVKFAHDPSQLVFKIQDVVTSWGEGSIVNSQTDTFEEEVKPQISESHPGKPTASTLPSVKTEKDALLEAAWRDMLTRTLHSVAVPLLSNIPGSEQKVKSLVMKFQSIDSIDQLNEIVTELNQILLGAEMQNDALHRIQNSLIQMLHLLVDSFEKSVIEDQWLKGQTSIINELILKPIDLDSLFSAESSLRSLIINQANIRPGLVEAKESVKRMIKSSVANLSDMSISTKDYESKIEDYQSKIALSPEKDEVSKILLNLQDDISIMREDAHQYYSVFKETQKKVEDAEQQIIRLTAELDYISEIAHQDFLTGALNRRGLDEAISKEFSRADRHNTILSLALLDIDHFKKLNDNLGHATGDEALTYLVKIIKQAIRSTDVVARYGGEEFVILFPGTKQDDAVKVMKGVQRELTKNLFMHNEQHILITFSAGVAERMPGQNIDVIFPIADSALYSAKKAGRNMVVGGSEINHAD